MRRVLVAILSIDVVGYSRLMGRDERRTVGRLHENREIIARTVEDHGGRVFGVAGDSEMAAFEDECAMLQAALEIQEKIADINAELPKTERMLLRIGLGYGRVIKEGPDLYGDGVNIAARVMALAGANEIYTTEAFYHLVKHDAPCGFVSIGRHQLKNIRRPIRVYKIIPREAVLPVIGTYLSRATQKQPRRLALTTLAAAGIMMVALIPVRGELGPWIRKAADFVGLEHYIWSAERQAALALGDGEWQLAERQRSEAEAEARLSAEERLAEAVARADAEARAREEVERLLRLAEARALTAEEERLLADQLAQMARDEAERLTQAHTIADTHRLEAERQAERARGEAQRAAQARIEAEAEAQAAAALAAKAQEEAQAARRALEEQQQAEQAAAEKLSEIVARIGPQRTAALAKRQEMAEQQVADADGLAVSGNVGDQEEANLQLAALSGDQADVEVEVESNEDRIAAFGAFLKAEQSLLETRLVQSLREKPPLGSNRQHQSHPVVTNVEWETVWVSDNDYTVILRYDNDEKQGPGYFLPGVEEVVHIRWLGDDIEILSREEYVGQEVSAENTDVPPSARELPGTMDSLQVALQRFMLPNPPPEIKHVGFALNAVVFLHSARVLRASPPSFTIALGWSLRDSQAQHTQVRDDIFEVRWQEDDVEVLRWVDEFQEVEGAGETTDTLSSVWQLPGSLTALNRELGAYIHKHPPPGEGRTQGLRGRVVLRDASVVEAKPPIFLLNVHWETKTQWSGDHVDRWDMYEVRWEGDEIEILGWRGEGEKPEVQPSEAAADDWPPTPSDPALLELEEQLWETKRGLEKSLASYFSAHVNEISEIDYKAPPLLTQIQLRNLRALSRSTTRASVLMDLGVSFTYGYYSEFQIVIDITSEGRIEILHHRSYIDSEWRSADVEG